MAHPTKAAGMSAVDRSELGTSTGGSSGCSNYIVNGTVQNRVVRFALPQ
jgi:hypothetical protein